MVLYIYPSLSYSYLLSIFEGVNLNESPDSEITPAVVRQWGMALRSSNLLLVFARTVILGFGPRRGP
jgi:hypothetical protein